MSRRPLVRSLIASWLRAQPIVTAAVEAEESDSAALPDADLLLLDARDSVSFTAAQAVLRGRSPALKVLVLTAGRGDYVLMRAAAFATGVVHDMDGADVLHSAIVAVASGGVYYSASVMQRQGAVPLRALTGRELAILEHACAGASDDETAVILGCSSATVETHRRNTMRKLGTRDWLELAVLGIRLGIVSAEQIPIGTRCRRSSSRRKTP